MRGEPALFCKGSPNATAPAHTQRKLKNCQRISNSLETITGYQRLYTHANFFADLTNHFKLSLQGTMMKKLTMTLVAMLAITLVQQDAFAQRDGDRPERGPRDGERREGDRERDGDRGPREGGPREGGDREGGRGGFGRGGFGGRGFGPPPNPLMEALDTDKDGELSADEIAGAVAALKKMDKNNDGKLAGDEVRPPRPDFGGRGGFGRPGEGGPEGGRGPGDMIARLMENDKNEDGKLSKDELPEFIAARLMERADKNKDDFLDKAELEEMAASRGPWGPRGDGPPREGDRPREGERPRDGEREGDRPRRPE